MLYTVTYTTQKSGEKRLECGENITKATEIFLRENTEKREVILWQQKPRKAKVQRGKKKSAQVLGRKTILAISEVGTLEITQKKQIEKPIPVQREVEKPKPTRKPKKKETPAQDIFDLFNKIVDAKNKKVSGELNIDDFISRVSKAPPKPSKPKIYNRTVAEMNIGDIFIRWDGEEFVKIGKNLIENTETGKLENCEISCKGKVVGNRFGETKKTITQENRAYATTKKQKPSALPHVGENKVKISDQKFVEVKDENGEIHEVPLEKFFSRKTR